MSRGLTFGITVMSMSFGVSQWVVASGGPQSCAGIYIQSGGTAPSGYYEIYPDGETVIDAYCNMTGNRGWTIIDPAHDPNWGVFFSAWDTFAGGLVKGIGSSPVSWREWFLLADETTEFAHSPDCQALGDTDGPGNRVYRMTGNYYGCFWFNDNCDFDGDCHRCVDDWGRIRNGTCPWITSVGDYSYPASCSFDWWNTAPSIGNNGTHCVAYTPPGGAIPTVSAWGLIVMALLVLSVGTLAFRRCRAAHE